MFGDHVTLFQSLQLTVIAMSIVFVVLFAISLIIETFQHIIPKEKVVVPVQKKTSSKPAPTPAVSRVNMSDLTNDEEKMIVAFVASMEAAGTNKDSNYRIASIKQL